MARATLTFLRLVPRNALSRFVGFLTRGPWPRALHQLAIRLFVKAFSVDMTEASRPITGYRTLNDFFTRTLRSAARPVADGATTVVCPCDGTVGCGGPIADRMLLQVKGRPYSLEAFVGDAARADRYVGGTFLTLYLAPHNYHRVHFPVSGEVTEALHIPGTLWPVNPGAVDRIDDLFAVNERVVTSVAARGSPVAIVMVGATCVGRIRLSYDDLVTNDGTQHGHRSYDPPLPCERGGELGIFELGSTVVLLFGPGVFTPADDLEPGRRVKMGERVGSLS